MTRNSLLRESLRRDARPAGPGVWRMAWTLVGAMFGAPSASKLKGPAR